jgi:3'-phosphoadenosine 5'-phosphosulfate sulfotransferase (PAPS reductase)/FAD synthetase
MWGSDPTETEGEHMTERDTMTEQPHYVVSFSGGAGSWASAKRIWGKAPERLTLLVADTNTEAPDWHPFLEAAHRSLPGADLVILNNDGRDIWDVFRDARFIGNSRIDPCSRVLKREPLRQWLETNCDPADTVVVLGFDWTEQHRLDRARPHWVPWTIEAPLCEPPYLSKPEVLDWLRDCDIPIPELYTKGFSHNNCGGGCVKAGQTEWRRLLFAYPDRYAYHERREGELREMLGKDVSVLRDRSGGNTRPVSLREFRENLERDASLFDAEDWGACSCMDTLGEVSP